MVLNPRQYAYILDLTKGNVNVYVGPHKTSLANTDRPVRFSPVTKRFEECRLEDAIQECPSADESSYIVLENPAIDEKDAHANPGPNLMAKLKYGRKINIPGPVSFPLWPGQIATVIPGHNLRSNTYLLVRVYNEDAAKENWAKAVIKAAQGAGSASKEKETPNLVTGQLLIIRGTEVSFYIPPTGLEVVPDESGNYTRNAVTLERMEYCILLDENGNRRYVQGPAVVFPKPTETFISRNGTCKFKAIELNEQCGLHIKVIAPYEEDGKKYKEGEELFITGKDTKIYFPRPEHSIIMYGNQVLHYAVAIPAGEGRYVLDKETGMISLIKGPQMFLADPRKQAIVRRVLSPELAELLYPSNAEVIEYNKKLASVLPKESKRDFVTELDAREAMKEKYYGPCQSAPTTTAQAWELDIGAPEEKSESAEPSRDDFEQSERKPVIQRRMVMAQQAMPPIPTMPTAKPAKQPLGGNVMDIKRGAVVIPEAPVVSSKFDGAVSITVWTGYAVLLVSKSGKRRVVVGPQTAILEYDEVPQILELSTGTPKTDKNIIKTAYLRVVNNKVSDIVDAVTKDLVQVSVRLSYRVNFEGEPEKWFNVENYINFLCDHTRSLIRNAVKQVGISEFNQNAISIIRDTILGKSDDKGKRAGRKFDENGMRVYDVEVLDVTIGDETISEMLIDSQHEAVRLAIELSKKERELEDTKKMEKIEQELETVRAATESLRRKLESIAIEEEMKLTLAKAQADAKVASERLAARQAEQAALDAIHKAELARMKASEEHRLSVLEREQAGKINLMNAEAKALVEKASAITPQMTAALQAFGDKVFVEKLMEALGPHALLRGNTIADVFAQLVNGTPEMAAKLRNLIGSQVIPIPIPAEIKDDKAKEMPKPKN